MIHNAEYKREWAKTHPESCRASRIKWALAHPQQVLEAKRKQARKYAKEHRFELAMFSHLVRLAFPDTIKARKKKEYVRNRERYKASGCVWRTENANSIRESKRIYHLENRSSCLARAKCWHQKYPDRVRVHKIKYKAKRRAIEKMAVVSDSRAIATIYTRAQELRKWFNVVVDHIIPLSKGGTHSSDNLQIIYRSENCRKNASLTYKPSVIFT